MQKISLPAPGSELELIISDLNTDGSAVAKSGGLVFFVDSGLPGESVLARVKSVKKNVAHAEKLKTLHPSPSQVEPFCPHFGDCGGCAWQNLDYQAQLLWKHGRVDAALRRIAKVEADLPPLVPSPAQKGFRNKMEYAFGPETSAEGAPVALGLRRRASHDICPLIFCPLQSNGSAKVLEAVTAWARKHKLTPWNGRSGALRHFILRESVAANGEISRMAELVYGPDAPPPSAGVELHEALQPLGVVSFTLSQRRDKSPLSTGAHILRRFGRDSIAEQIGHMRLDFPAQGFVQTNAAAAGLLYDQARELAELTGEEEVWDLYCGVGALGLYMAAKARLVLGVEISGEAVEMATKNAASLGFGHCRFVKGDAMRVLPTLPGRPDLLITDPPRGGMAAGLIPVIKQKSPQKIVYVSCDPATLARDVAALAPKYELKKIRAVDMFPHTPHVECVALLELASLA